MDVFFNLPGANFPNPEGLSFSVSTFYNRVFTVGQILDRPRNLYHQWKEEKLIPPHFGRDFWWQFQDIFQLEELEEKGWDKLNFVEACWVMLVDIMRSHGIPKKHIAYEAELYFKVPKERIELFKSILQQNKENMRERFKSHYKGSGETYARDDFNRAFREVAATTTYGSFDTMLLTAVYQRQPLSFVISHKGRLLPFIEGDTWTSESNELIDEVFSGPHVVIPFYKIVETLLFDYKFTHFSQPITHLNEMESFLIKSIRDKRIREINIKKDNKQEVFTIRQREGGYIDISEERRLLKMLQKKEYHRIEFTEVKGGKKFFEAESVKKIKVG